jgi:hypothetical protein
MGERSAVAPLIIPQRTPMSGLAPNATLGSISDKRPVSASFRRRWEARPRASAPSQQEPVPAHGIGGSFKRYVAITRLSIPGVIRRRSLALADSAGYGKRVMEMVHRQGGLLRRRGRLSRTVSSCNPRRPPGAERTVSRPARLTRRRSVCPSRLSPPERAVDSVGRFRER